ncbi:hypothetical protein BDB01DRAFT_845907 [Pilobolus umbonatus]|nr:hypothetical protein BDB01DRAFT_845907 [Pilobolus umbonatus]
MEENINQFHIKKEKRMKNNSNKKNEPTHSAVPDFIQKLFRMLDNEAFRDIFCWNLSGNTFIVKDTNEFSKTVLPKHFKHCNFASFVRQLNKYDFHKIRSNPEDNHKYHGGQMWEFEHAYFKRDRRDLLEAIKRKTPGKKKKADIKSIKQDPSPPDTMTTVTTESEHADNNVAMETVDNLRTLVRSLQSEINHLKQSHIELESAITLMNKKDEQTMAELSEFQETLKEKDVLIQQCLKLSQQQNETSNKIFPPSVPEWTEPTPIVDNVLPFTPNHTIDTASVAAAAQMNRGSLIGSSMKTPDGLALLSLTRVPSEPTGHTDNNNLNSHVNLPHPNQSKMKGLVSWTNPPRVLLVDDDSVYRDMSGKMLSMYGCNIDYARDGLEALHMMGTKKYDLILMDIIMPKMNGIATTRKIRKYDTSTPIVSMTSNFTNNDIMEYIGIGMNDILPKPFSKSTLYEILEKHCAHLKIIENQYQRSNIIMSGCLNTPTATITPILEDSTSTPTTPPPNTVHTANNNATIDHNINTTPTSSPVHSTNAIHSYTPTPHHASILTLESLPHSTNTPISIDTPSTSSISAYSSNTTSPTTTESNPSYWHSENKKLVWSSSPPVQPPNYHLSASLPINKRQKPNDHYDPSPPY